MSGAAAHRPITRRDFLRSDGACFHVRAARTMRRAAEIARDFHARPRLVKALRDEMRGHARASLVVLKSDLWREAAR